MGHERVGFLPKTKKWIDIVEQFSLLKDGIVSVTEIATRTLNNVNKQYNGIYKNESIFKAYKFLIILTVSSNVDNQQVYLRNRGLDIEDLTLFSIIRSAKNFVQTNVDSLDINKMAQDALLQVITKYDQKYSMQQLSLLREIEQNHWNSIGNGSVFCELSRSFFSSFTENYLRYFLERESARSINDITKTKEFTEQLSQHTFETAKITQSFAAGWFNKFAVYRIPNDNEITRFLKIAFGKMSEELRLEASKDD